MRSQNTRDKSNQRKYSYQDMKLWVQRMIETKTQLLLSQINQNNSIIKILSQKLSKAETELNKKQQLLETACQKLFSWQKVTHNNNGESRGMNIQMMNKLLNDKLKDKFQTVNAALGELQNRKVSQSRSIVNVTQYQAAMEKMMTEQIQAFKQQLRSKMEDIKGGNQKYWGKIKGWAKTFEEKEKKCEEGIMILHKQIKKSGESVAEGIMELFKLKSFKGRVRQMEKTVYDLEQSFKLIGQRQIEMKNIMETKQYRPQTIQLSYSKDESQIYYIPENTKKSKKSQKDQFQTTSDEYYQLRDLSKSPIRDQAQSRAISNSSSLYHNFCKKPPLQQFSILSSVKSDELRESFSSRVKSLQNVSTHIAQSRKLMVNDVRDRLKSLIQIKGLETPLRCYSDEFGYLKNEQDNYMFDCEGNMFKLSQEQFKQLCYVKVLMMI